MSTIPTPDTNPQALLRAYKWKLLCAHKEVRSLRVENRLLSEEAAKKSEERQALCKTVKELKEDLRIEKNLNRILILGLIVQVLLLAGRLLFS